SLVLGRTVIITPEGVPVTVGIATVGSCGKGKALTLKIPKNVDNKIIVTANIKNFLITNSPQDTNFL
ncbi:MAG TPA: hypothetical protein VK856_14580, partial [Anaerolineaceae bacterium]|nr:hypothetical protein [Anaerolineaceae bacterium]